MSSTSVDVNNVHAIKCQDDNMNHTHLFKGFFGKIFLGIFSQKSSKKSWIFKNILCQGLSQGFFLKIIFKKIETHLQVIFVF